ncbi:pheophytinase, chloroplastic-like [Bidens hawaiensis]|uniref:pheophytinase, chloroplastic-like n=1 Tax=Bidens hawaiensis TaxID=980011 RepID=UPI00404B6EC0
MAGALTATATVILQQPPVPLQRRPVNVRRKFINGVNLSSNNNNNNNCLNSIACRSTASTSAAGGEITDEQVLTVTPLEVNTIKEICSKWEWRGYNINYLKFQGQNGHPPLLLVHGFGASVAHWQRNIPTLAQTNTVYGIDLLGFGASDKPMGFPYTMEAWAELILDFLEEIVQKPTVLVGNSVGSLACVIAAADAQNSLVKGLVLLNCAGGMNNKALVDDWRIKLVFPLLWLIDFLLKQKAIASFISLFYFILLNLLLHIYY